MEILKKKLNIDDTFTKGIPKPKHFTKISDVVTLIKNYNYMADLLHLPTTSDGYKYLFVMVDLATKEFDVEPMKNKTSKETLQSMKNIFKRDYLKPPKASIRTDNGTEFMKEFDEYLKKKKIFHSVSMPYRHTQLSMVERLNKELGYLLNHYMNSKEEETDEEYKEWTDILDIIREDLNKIREKKAPYTEKTVFEHKDTPMNLKNEPKYKKNDIVHYYLDYPENALGKKQPTDKFRTGDYRWSKQSKKIVNVLYYSGDIPYRYMLDGMPYVSFTENQLMKSKNQEQTWIVRQIINDRIKNKKKEYKVWWKGYLKRESTWESESKLIEDGLQEQLQDYNVKSVQ